MSALVIDKPTTKAVDQPVEKKRPLWELHVIIPGKTGRVFGRATLRTIPEVGLFSERVKMTIWTSSTSPGDFGFDADVDGERFADRVDMLVHIFGTSIRFSPMSCEGTATIDKDRYEGTWTMPCLDPEDCGCDGNSGQFYLTAL